MCDNENHGHNHDHQAENLEKQLEDLETLAKLRKGLGKYDASIAKEHKQKSKVNGGRGAEGEEEKGRRKKTGDKKVGDGKGSKENIKIEKSKTSKEENSIAEEKKAMRKLDQKQKGLNGKEKESEKSKITAIVKVKGKTKEDPCAPNPCRHDGVCSHEVLFLVACTRLYSSLCPSVGPSVITSLFSIFLGITAPAQSHATVQPCIRPCCF